jgi:predicted CoA-substrate-specific enzyme activase
MEKKYYLGLDIGSTSTKAAIVDENIEVVDSSYIMTEGKPIEAIMKCLSLLKKNYEIVQAATTGSGRRLAKAMINADLEIDEITAHAVGVTHFVPDAKTIIEIGGQDSKNMILEDGVVIKFSLNNLCSAGTGVFLEHQANRLKVPIERFGDLALRSKAGCTIASKCTVFAETSMISKQSMGYKVEDIINGLCHSMVRNYINILVKNEKLLPPVVFCGGVSENIGVKYAFEEALEAKVIVPKHNKIIGSIGAAIIAKEEMDRTNQKTSFDFNVIKSDFKTKTFFCSICPNQCEISQIVRNETTIAFFGSRCGRYI